MSTAEYPTSGPFSKHAIDSYNQRAITAFVNEHGKDPSQIPQDEKDAMMKYISADRAVGCFIGKSYPPTDDGRPCPMRDEATEEALAAELARLSDIKQAAIEKLIAILYPHHI
jgi:hypothetical protein